MSEWQPIVTAPYEVEIWLRSEQGNIEKGRIEKTKFDEPLVWELVADGKANSLEADVAALSEKRIQGALMASLGVFKSLCFTSHIGIEQWP